VLLLPAAQAPGLLAAAVLLALAGFWVGGIFAFAGLHRVADTRAVVAPLYAADLVGAGLAAVVGGLLLLPILGLPAVAGGAALLALAGLLLV
jgi:hypothetical protein